MFTLEQLGQVQRDRIKNTHQHHHLFKTHIEVVLDAVFCFKVSIVPKDYSGIWLHSCLPTASSFPYQLLSEAIEYIKNRPNFLDTTSSGCLNGRQVQNYSTKLNTCEANLQLCFEELGDCFLLDKGETNYETHIEITDGMHRLVAYGLVSEMDETHFPISAYLGTNKPLQSQQHNSSL
jgi:hypothetical protein